MNKHLCVERRRIMKKTMKKTVAFILMLSLLCTTKYSSVFEETVVKGNEKEVKKVVENVKSQKLKAIKEIKSERTKNSTTYLMNDGSKKLDITNQDTRFLEDGKWVDYDTKIVKKEKGTDDKLETTEEDSRYIYENARGDYKNYFAEQLTIKTPIILKNRKYEISILPEEDTYVNEIEDGRLAKEKDGAWEAKINKKNDSEIIYSSATNKK